jgi:CRP/FNR family cyclic AMP-dependent transcriptional regulator
VTTISHELWTSSSIGRDLSDAEARELFLVSRRETYAQGETLFQEGDEAVAFFLIVDGEVGIEKSTDGGPVLIASLEKGAVIGEMSLLIGEPRSAAARVRTGPATVLRIDWKDFQQLMNENRAAALKLVFSLARLLAHRLKQINLKVAELSVASQGATGAEKIEELAHFKAKLFKDWSF